MTFHILELIFLINILKLAYRSITEPDFSCIICMNKIAEKEFSGYFYIFSHSKSMKIFWMMSTMPWLNFLSGDILLFFYCNWRWFKRKPKSTVENGDVFPYFYFFKIWLWVENYLWLQSKLVTLEEGVKDYSIIQDRSAVLSRGGKSCLLEDCSGFT